MHDFKVAKWTKHKGDNREDVGCFGLTELGFGNNATMMETLAEYDLNSDEFVVNTPTVEASKYWITNGALHAHHCILFARLLLGGQDQGVHAFLVPIRDQNLQSARKRIPGQPSENFLTHTVFTAPHRAGRVPSDAKSDSAKMLVGCQPKHDLCVYGKPGDSQNLTKTAF
ncbi:acyl-CoA dehydrogenase, middle domain protein [Opisthorchis viverrini]|uniref:Acyl-CoA dehydrogenase, middle domain protein n=1 Tax=Opisthorchis viverrini TaxID=6198 RepID=A0A1S8WMH0_OPIVI|nr:acyl-CoA dehydrogenase, middle domain protein [Opisthorchis viverrini]